MSIDNLLPDADAVRKAASKLSKLPKALQPSMKARLLKRAKALGITLDLSNATDIDLSVPQAWRDACKAKGLTFPGTDAFPLGDAQGNFDRGMAAKAVEMVGVADYSQRSAIKKWIITKLDANHASDLIPENWETNRPGVSLNMSVTEGEFPFDPKGDELAEVTRQVKGIAALKAKGNTGQATAAAKALIAGKCSRARKMPDGSRRAHKPLEVAIGLRRLGLK